MKGNQKVLLLVVLVLNCGMPLRANNPPQPDAVFGVLLIFPVVLIGSQLATISPPTSSISKRWITRLALGLCFILTLGGTEIGLLGLLGIFVYGMVRGIRIIQGGRRWRARVIGSVAVLWVIFAVGDYYVSLAFAASSSVALGESLAVGRLRTLATAEADYKNAGPGNGTSYGTIAELLDGKFVEGRFAVGETQMGYQLGERVEAAKGQFLFYEIPVEMRPPRLNWLRFVPGASVVLALRGKRQQEYAGERSFAVDETGVIRWAARSDAGPVTREEFLRWPSLQ